MCTFARKMDKQYKLPAIVWLRMTDYTHGWLQWELGGEARIGLQRVISVQHLPGAREVFRSMESVEEMLDPKQVGNSMSATWKNCIEAGIKLDPDVIRDTYGMTKEELKLFIPVECPKMCLTKNGVIRPWTLDVNFGPKQAAAMQRLLREEFWKAVSEYNKQYARKKDGKKYPAIEMIEAFCAETKTSELYVDAMRREWQRRQKRLKDTLTQGQPLTVPGTL